VNFSDRMDALRALNERNGFEYSGRQLRVGESWGCQDNNVSRRRARGGRRELLPPPPASMSFHGLGTGYRAIVKGLPESATWQEVKVCCDLLKLVTPRGH
jgi:hypothetical protein